MVESVTPEPLNSGSETRASNIRGAFFLLGAGAFFAITAALVKATAQHDVSVFQLLFIRAVLGLLILAPLLYRARIAPWKTDHLQLHLTRAATGGIAVTIGFYAFTILPLATVTAINFTMPLFTTILAVVILKEVVGWRRWSATALGFFGVLVMIQPGTASFDPIALIVLIQAACIAFSVTVVKRFPVKESQLSMMSFTFVSSGIISVWPAMEHWIWPDLTQTFLILAVALSGIAAQAMVLKAYRLGEASYLAPISYTRLLFAGLLGILFFAEYPDTATWVGAAIIIVAAFYTARRSSVRRANPKPAP